MFFFLSFQIFHPRPQVISYKDLFPRQRNRGANPRRVSSLYNIFEDKIEEFVSQVGAVSWTDSPQRIFVYTIKDVDYSADKRIKPPSIVSKCKYETRTDAIIPDISLINSKISVKVGLFLACAQKKSWG